MQSDCQIEGTVDQYFIDSDIWTDDTPLLNVARQGHSSCALGENIYVFGGVGEGNVDLNSIERLNLNVANLLNDDFQSQWTLIQTTLQPQLLSLIYPINKRDILVLGGWTDQR